jgi:hypothetical protein
VRVVICYRDMTFCADACATKDCPRQFGPDQQAAAERWWGEPGAPVMFANFAANCPTFTTPEGAD